MFAELWNYDSYRVGSDDVCQGIVRSRCDGSHVCLDCGKRYRYQRGLQQHQRYECGKEPMFKCPHCPRRCNQPVNLKSHLKRCKNRLAHSFTSVVIKN